ncbi:HNH endonuclease [Desulfuromonas sp. TF]|uniref:HNH endonuclease n=1 Tax=Desulfuromonas sp. TF TaxID=1232410 RepID=UPI001D045C27
MFDNQKVRGYVPCRYCGRKLTFAQATLDHINPLSRGGEWMQSNLGFACRACNSAKGNKNLIELA